MSDAPQGHGWWLASDGKWYPPDTWAPPPPQVAQFPPTGQAPPWGGTPPAYGAPPTIAPRTNGLSIASLVCSIAGIVPFFFGVPCILGIVFGFVSRSQIRRSHGVLGGEGLGLAGIIIGFCLIGIFLLVVVLAVAFGHDQTCTTNSHNTILCSNN